MSRLEAETEWGPAGSEAGAGAGAGAEEEVAPRQRRGSLKGSRGSGLEGAAVRINSDAEEASVGMSYYNRAARLPYNWRRNQAAQLEADRELARLEAEAEAARLRAEAEARAREEAERARAQAEAEAQAQAQAQEQNAYNRGLQQGYHEVRCEEGEQCSIQGGTRRQRKIKRRSKGKASRRKRNVSKRKCSKRKC